MGHGSFASDFPAASYAQWRALAEKAIVPERFDGLQDHSDEVAVAPLYGRAVNPPRLLVGPPGWAVMQRVDHPDPASANEVARTDLENGADGLVIIGANAGAARGFGLPCLAKDTFHRILEGVVIEHTTLRLDGGPAGPEAAIALQHCVQERPLDPEGLKIDFGIDPVGAMAWAGGGTVDGDALRVAARIAKAWTGSRACLADGRPHQEAGALPARELACVLATALFYLRALEDENVAPDRARRSLSFLLVADADILLTLAKFRALRFLWARVEAACGLAPMPIRLHAETGWQMMTRQEPQLNIVRTTIAGFAAGLGGADAITILPHTLALELPDASARRIARNTQRISQAEAGLARVADPAAGSGAFESLTQQLCIQAWAIFQSIEKAGGMPQALRAGMIPSGRARPSFAEAPA